MSPSTNPTVCAVMLVNGRAPMVARAIRSFRDQTYPEKNRRLLIFDTTPDPYVPFDTMDYGVIHAVAPVRYCGLSIGRLRNEANSTVPAEPTDGNWIICHWDSDDWSHPRRIEEQVALLQASGKECVGYRDMLFWRESRRLDMDEIPGSALNDGCTEGWTEGAAWLYTNGDSKYCLGTSLCYWRRVWEARPFEDLPKGPTGAGEDTQWLRGVDAVGVESIQSIAYVGFHIDQPRTIASVHRDNTTSLAALGIKHGTAPEWRRAGEWDVYCRERMAL